MVWVNASSRKYHFGAASVPLGTAWFWGSAQSTAMEETTADNKTEAVTSTPKDGEGVTSPTNVICQLLKLQQELLF